jgi:hypothetical protein
MLPPEMMGGAPSPEAGGQDPLAAMMGMLGGGGGPEGPPAGPPAPEGGGSNVDALQAALEALTAYVDGEDDEIHIQTALKCLAQLQSILADEQKSSDDMLQGKSTPRALRKATSGQGY